MVVAFKVPSIDFTSRDFASIRDDLIKLIPFFTPEWTDHNPSDQGIVLLELCGAYVGDSLHFYTDRTKGEAHYVTAVTQEAHTALNKLINYQPGGYVAATVTVKFTLTNADTANVTIPKNTIVSTGGSSPIYFETDAAAIIPAGQTVVSVTATQGISRGSTDSILTSPLLGTSDGTPFQSFKFTEQPIIDSTLRLFVDESGAGTHYEYRSVAHFSGIAATERVFRHHRGDDGFSVAVFGDGVTGKVPPATSSIRSIFRVGGGTAGNVGAATIITMVSNIVGLNTTLTVSNAAAASGGEAPETLPEQKENAPLSFSALNRAVNIDDYRAIAKTVDGVYDAYVTYDALSAQANVAVAPAGGGLPSTALKDAVLAELDEKNCIGADLVMVNPTIIPINVIGAVYLTTAASKAELTTNVDTAVEDFLEFGETNSISKFGQNVYLSDLIALIDNIEGVDHVDITKFSRTPVPVLDSWRDQSSTITVTVGEENEIEQTLTVTMSTDAPSVMTYTVSGDVSGLLGTGTATISPTAATAFQIAAASVEFNLSVMFSSSNAVGPGDAFTVTIGKYLGNQTISGKEIPDNGTITLTYTGGIL